MLARYSYKKFKFEIVKLCENLIILFLLKAIFYYKFNKIIDSILITNYLFR